MRIVIVEDDPLEQRFLAKLFKAEDPDCDVQVQDSAETALADLSVGNAIEDVDWMVVDLRLPRADGFTLVDAVDALPAAQRPRIVMFTTSDHHQDLREARQRRVDAYFVKGFGDESAKRLVQHVLGPPGDRATAVRTC